MCCFPNSPIDADLHQMKNAATNSAVDEITSEEMKIKLVVEEIARFNGDAELVTKRILAKMIKSFPHVKDICTFENEHPMKNTTSAADEITSEEWGIIRAMIKRLPPFTPGRLKYEDATPRSEIEEMIWAKFETYIMMRVEVGIFIFRKAPRNQRDVREVLMEDFELGTKDIDKLLLKICIGPTGLYEAWKCDICGGAGRYADARKYEKIKSGVTGINSVNYIEYPSAYAQLYFTYATLRASRQTVCQDWYMDSGATHHFCDSKAKFLEYSPGGGGMCVVVANNAQAEVAGTGNVLLMLTSGESVVLKDVLHVPTINRCLISVSKLNEDGFGVNFEAQKVVIYQNSRVIGDGYNEGGMFRLNINNDPAGASTSGTGF